jgi:4'-phosphopantetheinyl transferase
MLSRDDTGTGAGYNCKMLLGLEATQAHVWYLPLVDRGSHDLRRAAQCLMSSEELARAQSFLNPKARDLYLLSRSFMRAVLSQYADVRPQDWKFRTNRYGKPEIASPASAQSLRFNLTNTDGLVGCAVAFDRDVGIDAEAIDRSAAIEEIAEHFFTPAEAATLRALPPDERSYRFFEIWTLKESYIKARGLGFNIPLNKFVFVVKDGNPIEIVTDPDLADDPGDWYFSVLRPTKGHLMALALARLEKEERASWRAEIELVVKPFDKCADESVFLQTTTGLASPYSGPVAFRNSVQHRQNFSV